MIKSPVPQEFIRSLLNMRRSYSGVLPARSDVRGFVRSAMEILFPHFTERNYGSAEEVALDFARLDMELRRVLKPISTRLSRSIDQISSDFFDRVPGLHERLCLDAEAIYQGDPAAVSVDEVILAYPGFYAIATYRIAHEFHRLEVPVFSRVMTEYAHQVTGIDIHPGAEIGESFCIDHGTGIVIGETTRIGSKVKIYQGVTLGALSVSKEMAMRKRHPTIEDNVVIYAQATILGGRTVIGHDSIIGGNVWLTESVPPYSTVYHKSEVKVKNGNGPGLAAVGESQR